MVERAERIMATEVSAHVAAEPGEEWAAEESITACMTWLKEVETRLTRFNEQSELSRLNAAAGTWQSVSPLLFEALEVAAQAAQESDGLFDPTLLAVLEALGYDRDFAAIQRGEQGEQGERGGAATQTLWVGEGAATAGGWRAIELDHAQLRVRLPFGVRIDLGGIAKGWAADVALERCFAPNQSALINVGGDMRARGGPAEGHPWPIALAATAEAMRADPLSLPVVALGAGGLAVSGAQVRWWYHHGQRQHHLIDPRTGAPAPLWIDAGEERPARDPEKPLIAAAIAFAPTAAHAEVAAKVAVMQGYPAALRNVEGAWSNWLNSADHQRENRYGSAPVALILALETGALEPSANLQDYLTTVGGGGTIWLT